MAIAIKAIPTLDGEIAVAFREQMECNEIAYASASQKRNHDVEPYVIAMRKMLRKSGIR